MTTFQSCYEIGNVCVAWVTGWAVFSSNRTKGFWNFTEMPPKTDTKSTKVESRQIPWQPLLGDMDVVREKRVGSN